MIATESLLKEELVLLDIEVNNTDEAIKELATLLYKKGYVKESYIKAVQEREKLFPTGLPTEGAGVAIPHTDAIHVRKDAMAIGILKEPVTFQMMGMPDKTVEVRIMFMMALKEPHSQIEVLQKLMEVFQEDDILKGIKECKKPSEVIKIFSKVI